MNRTRKPMAFDGGITEAVDWADLGRRIRTAAVEAAKLRIIPGTNVRGGATLMRHPRTVEIGQE